MRVSRWVLGLLDVPSGSFRRVEIEPKLPGQETSVSGLGVPVQQQ